MKTICFFTTQDDPSNGNSTQIDSLKTVTKYFFDNEVNIQTWPLTKSSGELFN